MQLLLLGSARKEELLDTDQGRSMLQRRAPKLGLRIARARENGQGREHCLYSLPLSLLAHACRATSHNTPTRGLWDILLGTAHFCSISEALMASVGAGTGRQDRLARKLGVLGAAHLRFS